jgi:hypothetical protein
MGLGEVIGLVGIALTILIATWQIRTRRSDQRREEMEDAEAKAAAEIQVADDLVRWLEDKRVLFNPIIKEIPHETIDSVLEIRERVAADAGRLKRPDAGRALDTIRSACHELLDAPRAWFQKFFSPEAETALKALREQVRPSVGELARAYGLDPRPGASTRAGLRMRARRSISPAPSRADRAGSSSRTATQG